MTLTYYKTDGVSHLINEIFYLAFAEEDIPFSSTILPNGSTPITYIYGDKQTAKLKNKTTELKGLMLSGPVYGSYQFSVEEPGHSFGISLHPTALYKITKLNLSKLKDKHIPLLEIAPEFNAEIKSVFNENDSDFEILASKIRSFFKSIPLATNTTIQRIDLAINLITEKEGMLNVNEILHEIPFSQKTLETKFKKIVGLTPGKYIRAFRFLKLMKKYESQQINLKDLIYMYNYYDQSHFAKDFKLFMKESPLSYFEKERPLLKEYLKH